MPQDNRLTQLKKQDATVTPQDNRYAAPKASGHIPRQDTTVVPQDNRFAASKVSENYDQGVDYSPIKKPSDYQDKRIKRPSQDSNISSYKAAMDQSGSDQYQGDDWKVVVPNPTQRTDDDDDDLISRQKLAEVCHCHLPIDLWILHLPDILCLQEVVKVEFDIVFAACACGLIVRFLGAASERSCEIENFRWL